MSESEDPWVTAECLGLCGVVSLGPLMMLVGMCCLIAAVSTSHWLELTHQGKLLTHGGLFEVCSPVHNNTCRSWDDSPLLVDDTVYVKLCIAALILACLGYLIGFFMMSGFAWQVMDNERPSWKSHTSWGTACLLNISGLGMFVKFQHNPHSAFHYTSILKEYDYGYSFHLCWICLALVVVGCGATGLVSICCAGAFAASGGETVKEPEENKIRDEVNNPLAPEERVTFTNDKETVEGV